MKLSRVLSLPKLRNVEKKRGVLGGKRKQDFCWVLAVVQEKG